MVFTADLQLTKTDKQHVQGMKKRADSDWDADNLVAQASPNHAMSRKR